MGQVYLVKRRHGGSGEVAYCDTQGNIRTAEAVVTGPDSLDVIKQKAYRIVEVYPSDKDVVLFGAVGLKVRPEEESRRILQEMDTKGMGPEACVKIAQAYDGFVGKNSLIVPQQPDGMRWDALSPKVG